MTGTEPPILVPTTPVRRPATPINPWRAIAPSTVSLWALKQMAREHQADIGDVRPSPKSFHDWVIWLLDHRGDYNP